MNERDIITNTITQLETLRESVKAQNKAIKDTELRPQLVDEIDAINARYDEAQAALVSQRNDAIAEKTAVYEATVEAYVEKSVSGLSTLIAEQKKLADKLGG